MQGFRAFPILWLSTAAALAQLGSVQNNAPNTPGPSLEQATAIRDVLMNLHQVADMPANRLYHPEGAK